MTPSLRASSLSVATTLLLFPLIIGAAGRNATYGSTTIKGKTTSVDFMNLKVRVPGEWTMKTEEGKIVFTQSDGDFLRLSKVPKEDCGYQTIRIKAQKLWGGANLQQSKSRIQPVSFGSSRYKGYKWLEPGTNGKAEAFWCLAQDGKNAVEISVLNNKELYDMADRNLLLQFAVRNAR